MSAQKSAILADLISTFYNVGIVGLAKTKYFFLGRIIKLNKTLVFCSHPVNVMARTPGRVTDTR